MTDQTSAHDPLNGYLPEGMSLADAEMLRKENPGEMVARAKKSMAKQVEAMLAFHRMGIPPSITATISARWLPKQA